jgi:predicted nucleic acid-binding protein
VSAPAPSTLLFDTSAVIGLIERRSPDLIGIVKSLGRPITRSITVFGELRHGAALEDRPGQLDRERTLDRYQRLSEWSEIETALDEVGQAYGDVCATASANELSLGVNDRWIIAECAVLRARLVTGDRRQAQLAELVGARLGQTIGVVIAD